MNKDNVSDNNCRMLYLYIKRKNTVNARAKLGNSDRGVGINSTQLKLNI